MRVAYHYQLGENEYIKTKCIVFGSRNIQANATALSLSIDGILVEQDTKTTLLGAKLDNLLSWS